MKRTLPLLLLALTVLAVGIAGMRQDAALRAWFRTAEGHAEAIGEAYGDIVERHVPSLVAANAVPARHPALPILTATVAVLEEPLILPERLQHISRLQTALWDLVRDAPVPARGTPEAQADGRTQAVTALREEIGSQGTAAPLLDAYNTAAVRWNRAQGSVWQSFSARLTGRDRNLLPYLRFDGKQESAPLIQL